MLGKLFDFAQTHVKHFSYFTRHPLIPNTNLLWAKSIIFILFVTLQSNSFLALKSRLTLCNLARITRMPPSLEPKEA